MSTPIVDATKISQRGQVVIPKEIRDRLGLKNGSKLLVIAVDDAIILQKAEVIGERIRFRDLLEKVKAIREKLTGR